jgi:hypothetical protein
MDTYLLGLATGLLAAAVYQSRGHAMSGKRYGTLRKEPIEIVEFELLAMREDADGEPQPEWHKFAARPQTDAGDLAAFAFAGDDGGRLMGIVVKMIRKMVINNDGVPEKWTPEPVDKPKNATEKYEDKFRAPDGKLMTMEHAEQFTAIEAGSSRRRMMHLLLEDDAAVDIQDVAEIMKDMMGIAAGRPTTAPSRS